MKLNVQARVAKQKGQNNRLRREGKIPAVLYSQGKPGEAIAVEGEIFLSLLRTLEPGHLPTTVITLVDKNGKERKALIKDIQYEPTTYQVEHLDFEELHRDVTVDVKVPIHFTGKEQCPGIKLGGVLRQVIRHYRVRCFPNKLPTYFELDVSSMNMKQSKRLREIQLPEGVKGLTPANEVAVVIAKR